MSDDLQFAGFVGLHVKRDYMLRMARLSVASDVPMGIFGLIGIEFAYRAVRAWRPKELHLMEDMSLAFDGIWRRLAEGISVPPLHVERMVEVWRRYSVYLGVDVSREELQRQLEGYIKSNAKAKT